jgi:hypothetical protein
MENAFGVIPSVLTALRLAAMNAKRTHVTLTIVNVYPDIMSQMVSAHHVTMNYAMFAMKLSLFVVNA